MVKEEEEAELDRELYALLHLSPQATDDEIRRAYRQWAQVYHPDKHQTPQMQGVATESFQKIREAYEILSDERKRKIYDLYGMEGLNSGMELGPKLKTVDEVLKGFEKLKQHRREQKMSERVQHSGSLLVDLSLAEMYRSLDNGPVLRGMTSNTEVNARISKKNSLALGGSIAFRRDMGGGTLSALFRHQISSEAGLEVLAMVGLRSLLSVQTSRQLSSHATGALGLSLSLVDGSINLTNTWTRQLSDITQGTIQIVIGPDTAVAVGWEGQAQRNSGSSELKIGQSGIGITAQFNHDFSAHSRGRIIGRLAGNAVEVEIGGERRISSHSALAMFCTMGMHGISYRFRFSRGGQKFIIPILLTPTLNPFIAAWAMLIPASLYAFLKVYVIKPYFLRRKEHKQREKRRSSATQVREARAKAAKAQLLLKNVADRKRDKQMKNEGLVIIQAIYGNVLDFENERQAQEFSEDMPPDDEDDIPPPVLDVTTTLNFLVDDGQLQLHGGVKKSGLIGFCDPCPGETKQLKVTYTFQNKKFEVTVGDFDELSIPDAAHRQII
eukprot:c18667_g1_i1 orf=202-1863(+)